jgi:uncharacterized protein (DUF1499 family)
MGLATRRTTPSRTLDVLGLVAMALFVLGPLLAWLRLVPALGGFVTFALGGLLALVVTVIAAIRAFRGRGFGRGGALAAAVAAVVFVWSAVRGGGTPMTNDFTTDLADPPAFTQAAAEPANAGRDLSYPADFAAVQRECCPDLVPIQVAAAPAAAFAQVAAVAASMPGWRITRMDAAAGELEAVATSTLFGFQDDVAIRVRQDPASGGSRVDVRSKSRDGKGDRGVNAARIRALRDALVAADRQGRG